MYHVGFVMDARGTSAISLESASFLPDSWKSAENKMFLYFSFIRSHHVCCVDTTYPQDHYKLALGQINTARHLIDSVSKDYVRLLKFGDSLYRFCLCKDCNGMQCTTKCTNQHATAQYCIPLHFTTPCTALYCTSLHHALYYIALSHTAPA